MSFAVVDVELFHGDIIKELAVCTESFTRCVSFLPPKNHRLTEKDYDVNAFLSKKMHRIKWFSGEFSYESLPIVVQLFTLPSVQLYSKGKVKCDLLSKIFKKEVKNLEDIGCPPIKQLDDIPVKCEAYPRSHHTNLHCAHKKVKTYYKWTQTHMHDIQ